MRHEGKHLQAVAVRDRLLQLVAKRMTDTVREADIVARVGGDEFVVAAQFSRDIPSSFDEDAVDVIDATARLARRLVAVLEEPFDLGDAGIPVLVGASVGVAVAPCGETKVEELLRRADMAMYLAKEAGRGCFRYFEPEMDASIRERRDGDCATPIHRGRRAVALPPAVRRARRRRPVDRLRDAGALIASRTRPCSPRRVHPVGRGNPPDRAHERTTAPPCLQRRSGLARPPDPGGECIAGAAARPCAAGHGGHGTLGPSTPTTLTLVVNSTRASARRNIEGLNGALTREFYPR
jgi:diguanylate cyclase (GGDEF)-like protein